MSLCTFLIRFPEPCATPFPLLFSRKLRTFYPSPCDTSLSEPPHPYRGSHLTHSQSCSNVHPLLARSPLHPTIAKDKCTLLAFVIYLLRHHLSCSLRNNLCHQPPPKCWSQTRQIHQATPHSATAFINSRRNFVDQVREQWLSRTARVRRVVRMCVSEDFYLRFATSV